MIPFRRSHRNWERKKKETFKLTSKDILLPVFTALLTVFVNQVFFVKNAETQAQLDTWKEIFKEQYFYSNRIRIFCSFLETDERTIISKTTLVYGNPFMPGSDSVIESKYDTVSYNCPSFVIDSVKRAILFEELDFFKKNREKIDIDIYMSLQKLLHTLEDNPLPNIKNDKEIENSVWVNQLFIKDWLKLQKKVLQESEKHMDGLFD